MRVSAWTASEIASLEKRKWRKIPVALCPGEEDPLKKSGQEVGHKERSFEKEKTSSPCWNLYEVSKWYCIPYSVMSEKIFSPLEEYTVGALRGNAA